jgi:DNA-binding transcriptional LysR family regulator
VIAAADHGSFRRAAAALGVQESAVSRRIRDLEYQLGAELFTRSASGVHLTSAGKQFVQRSRLAIAQIGLAGAEVGAIGRGDAGELKIGIDSSLGSEFLAKLIREYVVQYPTVRLNFVDGDQAAHVAAIRQFKLDVAFVTGSATWSDCKTELLWSERVFVALPQSHSLSTGDVITWQDLADESFIVTDVPPGLEMHDYLIQRLATPGHHPRIEHHAVGHLNLLALVALGRGATLACEGLAQTSIPGIVFRPVEEERLPFSAVWSAQNDNPAFKRFWGLVRR